MGRKIPNIKLEAERRKPLGECLLYKTQDSLKKDR